MAYVWQVSVASFKDKTMVSGVLLSSASVAGRGVGGRLSGFARLLLSYFIRPLAHAEIELRINNQNIPAITDENGTFNVVLDYSLSSEPVLGIFHMGKRLRIEQNYPLFFPYGEEKIGVISDIDDTILLSHTANSAKRVSTLFFVSPFKRKAIYFTKMLIDQIHKERGGVYFVSKSESNLFDVITSFIKHNGLPSGLLLLTPYRTLLKLMTEKKEKDFKLNNIDFIIKNSGDKKFVLFGDDTQMDMEIYTSLVKKYPGRIVKIYIRRTKRKLNRKKLHQWETLQSVFARSVLFTKDTDVVQEQEQLNELIKQI